VPSDAIDWPVGPDRHSAGGTVHLIALVTRQPDGATTCDRVAPAQSMVDRMQHVVVHVDALALCFGAVESTVQAVLVVRLTYTSPPAGLAHLTARLDADA
jgi:hypothetical protein